MAKTQKRKKKNFRLRRSVRRTLGALFLMSAIIIAAIPFPDSSATGEALQNPGFNVASTPLTTPNYSPVADTEINQGVTLTGNADLTAYTLLNIDGTWWYEWQFKFFLLDDGQSAIIGQYNKDYKTRSIELKSTINTGYDFILRSTVDDYFNTGNGSSEIVIDKNNYKDYINAKYFTAACNEVEAALQANPPEENPTRNVKPSDLGANERLEYYCEVEFDGGVLKNRGYTLVSALASSSLTGSGSADLNDSILIPKEKAAGSGDYTGTDYTEDANGFLYKLTNVYMLKGIGNEAFKGVNNVDTIKMSGQIQYIGDSAFEQSWVKEVSIANVTEIGNYAFKECNDLVSFTAENPLRAIGTEAFYNTSLQGITFPTTIKKIGYGAFAYNDKLSTITFTGGSDIEIGAYAFFNCPSLGSQNLADDKVTKIGEGAFALDILDDGTCTSFVFPEDIETADGFGDCILAGRTALQNVTMPAGLGRDPGNIVTLPIGTFTGCNNLAVVTFPESCIYIQYDPAIYTQVQNPDFYVTGPANISASSTDPAYPRRSTWNCTNSTGDPVPYVYMLDGKEYFEVSNGEYLLLIDDQGILISCSFLDTNNDGQPDPTVIDKLVIPDKVGNKIVSGIATGCFGDKQDPNSMLNNIRELVVADGGNIREVGDGVFEDADLLETVYIGDSVEKIGANTFANIPNLQKVTIGKNIGAIGAGAFQNCIALVDVEFKTPDDLGKLTRDKIGANAFSTNSNYLVVTGAISDTYGPFVWAMEPDNYVDAANGIRVCYKSGDPSNLTVILDNRNELPTLMDYPKFEDLRNRPVDILDENGNIIGTTNLLAKYQNNDILTPAEEAIINSTLLIDIPAGIKSIDTKGYLTNTSPLTVSEQSGKVITNTMNKSIYFTDNNQYGMSYPYGETYEDFGLFNGRISDPSVSENEVRGDDNIIGITMHTVEYLPTVPNTELSSLGEDDYTGGAFYSCENLERVDLGSGMKDVGSLPFLDCLSMREIDTTKTDNFTFENKILYETITELEGGIPVTGKEIVEVLHTRGLDGDADVNTMTDPKLSEVVQIAPGAFMNTNVGTVDLTGTPEDLRVIPEDCFKGSDGLVETILPEHIRIIRDGAFENTAENTTVTIKGREVDLENEAFKGNKAIVRTYKDTAAYHTALRIPNVTVRPLEDTFRVAFYNSITGELIKTVYAEEGAKVDPPEEEEMPKMTGYKFKGWNSEDYKNVTSDLIILALYDKTGNGNGGNGNGGNGNNGNGNNGNNGNGNNNQDSDGDGVPDYDANGNKLYKLTVSNGTGGGTYAAGTRVSITAGPASDGAGFANWSSTNKDVIFNDATKPTTTLVMPASDTTVVANYVGYYRLDVVYGSGSGSYPAGAKVTISAVDAPQGRSFASWKSSTTGLTIENARNKTTTVTMPKGHATVTATYMDNGTLNSSGSGSNSSSNGTQIIITKPGISDTNKASAYVSGSSDGFIVKISESVEATDAVQKALQKKYPDMTRIKYFAMDISLYDATGTKKITNTTGLKINITIPIPDALREYAGNNKIAAVVNGEIEDLAPKFTTIDGVPSITFTATHFSPYTVYVDTSNITFSNTLDATPKTGDGIHPKWFLSIGLASISMILFLKKDRRYVSKIS